MLADIAAEEANLIRSAISMGNHLIVFSSGAIWSMGGDLEANLKATEPPRLVPLSYTGASPLRPLRVNDRLLYVDAEESFIREVAFNVTTGNSEGFIPRDLSIWAEHYFRGYTFSSWTYARVPDSTAYCIRSDGVMLGFTYMPEHDIWAWHLHETGGDSDKYVSVAAIPENKMHSLYLVVERSINGTITQYYERMLPRKSGSEPAYDQRSDALYLDSYLTYDGTNAGSNTMTLSPPGSPTWLEGDTGYTLTANAGTPFTSGVVDIGNGVRIVDAAGNEAEVIITAFTSTTIVTVTLLTDVPMGLQNTPSTSLWVYMVDDVSGLSHLEGETVGVLADGHVLGQQTVTSGAIPTLLDFDDGVTARPYGIVHVGLPITAEFETLDIDFLTKGDSIADRKKAVNYVSLHLRNSRGVTAGPRADSQDDFEILTAEGEDEMSLVTGVRPVRIKSTPTRGGNVVVQQTDPVPCEVLGLTVSADILGR
jgi:hypothetical protein